jgi:hypothetical protein
MRKLIAGLVLLLVALMLLPVISYHYADANTTLPAFVSNLTLNIAAELLGVLITLSGVVIYAVFAARKKFESLATPIAELVAQLRCDGTLSPEAARRSMVCAVRLITPENITKKATPANEPLGLTNRPCDVCALPTTVGRGRPCKDCGVEDYIWSIEKKPVPLELKCKH